MERDNHIEPAIQAIREALSHSGYLAPGLFIESEVDRLERGETVSTMDDALRVARTARNDLAKMAISLQEKVINPIFELEPRIREPKHFDELKRLLEQLLSATENLRKEREHIRELVTFHARLVAVYILILYRCGGAGRESPIISMILRNIVRRKAIELGARQIDQLLPGLESAVTIAMIAKRYAIYVLVARGNRLLLRAEIDFRTYGTSPEQLALQTTNLLVENGIKLAEVTDLVCAGGDLGTIPDGTYELTEKVRNESWKRLSSSSLNRGPIVAWDLLKLLKNQKGDGGVNASLCSPLSFSTLGVHDMDSAFREGEFELSRSLQGLVKITPLKSAAALLSEIEGINSENLNLLVMTLDDLFASVVKKTGPRIVRELARQDANKILTSFDFAKIISRLQQENFAIPPHFRLASRDRGTGVGEICELLMIAESGNVSGSLAQSLMQVVDSYARQVAEVLQMACAGVTSERPHFIVVTSMRAVEPNFRQLFGKIRDRIDIPFTPVMCLDSFEHEYLIANHLFELYVSPGGDKRLQIDVEAASMRQALKVLESSGGQAPAFSFGHLLDEVTGGISDGTLRPANVVLVGADNEDALTAACEAKEQGLIDGLSLIGDPEDIRIAAERSKLPLSLGSDSNVEIIPIDPLATDIESKQKSMASVFRGFIERSPDHIIMKGSLDTAAVLREALSIYKSEPESGTSQKPAKRRLASHTALFVLPNGRFFALSDAGVNPSFRDAEALLRVIENQADVLRKAVDPLRTFKIAIITAVEKETPAIPSTLLAAEAAARAEELRERYGPLIVEGPLSFDLATAPEVAEEKHYVGQIRGDADCLVATDINTANVLYKMLSKTMGSLGLMVDNGGILTAGPGTIPIVLTSRGDTARTKLNSILLALAYTSRER